MVSRSAEVIEPVIVKCAGILCYSELRLKQAVIVRKFVSGKDIFVVYHWEQQVTLPFAKVFDNLYHRNYECA